MLSTNQVSRERLLQYEIFVSAVTMLALVNLAISVVASRSGAAEVAKAVDLLLVVILLVDVIVRMKLAPHPGAYLWQGFGWADVLGSLPVPYLRVMRLPRLIISLRHLRSDGAREIRANMASNPSSTSLGGVALLLLLLVEFGSMLVLRAERDTPNADIQSGSEAVWWAVVTLTTLGYGDYVPKSDVGRFIAVMIMALGIGLASVLTGYIANLFLAHGGRIPAAHERHDVDIGGQLQDLSARIAALQATVDGMREATQANLVAHRPSADDPTE